MIVADRLNAVLINYAISHHVTLNLIYVLDLDIVINLPFSMFVQYITCLTTDCSNTNWLVS